MRVPTQRFRIVHPLLQARDWQDRLEFAEISTWWRTGGLGVCALVGIGGAGKTAIVERFLRTLPDGLPPHPRIAKQRNLLSPEGAFVFSFYESPNADDFFAQLHSWLSENPVCEGPNIPSYQHILQLLASTAQSISRLLLVLDGLEKIQDTGSRGPFGRLLDSRLRDLVLRAADGWLPGVSIIITTRFRLFDPLSNRSGYFQQVVVDRLDIRASFALLRARGITAATDSQLLSIAEEAGFHALTLDLAGTYIAVFRDGDPMESSRLGGIRASPDVIDDDPTLDFVKAQERRLGRLVQRYREALRLRDPAMLALMERICLFRLGVAPELLAAVFCGEGKEAASGPALAALDYSQIKRKLRSLVEMHLLEEAIYVTPSRSNSVSQKSITFTIHPAIRDGFLLGLDENTRQLGHTAARQYMLASLGGLPGVDSFPKDSASLDLLEEIIYHCVQTGAVNEALDIYFDRMGGGENNLLEIGAFDRGVRTCRIFTGDSTPTKIFKKRDEASPPYGHLSQHDQAVLINDLALHLYCMGQITEAIHCFALANEEHTMARDVDASTTLSNLANALLAAGRLKEALKNAEKSLALAENANHSKAKRSANLVKSTILAALGKPRLAAAVLQSIETNSSGKVFTSVVDQRSLPAPRPIPAGDDSVRGSRLRLMRNTTPGARYIELYLAELHCEIGDLPYARPLLESAHQWGIMHDSKENQCWSLLVRAKIQIAEASFPEWCGNLTESEMSELLHKAKNSLDEGIYIARMYGYSIYHVDLLLERARIALICGQPEAALIDLRIAVDVGVPLSSTASIPVLVASNDPECGYVWGVSEGLHLRAQALLLKAAQHLGRSFIGNSGFKNAAPEALSLFELAQKCLIECRGLREAVEDPKVKDTNEVLLDFEMGLLTRFRIQPLHFVESKPAISPSDRNEDNRRKGFHVFLSHNSKDKSSVRELKRRLQEKGVTAWFDEDELRPGLAWQPLLEIGIKASSTIAVLIGKDGLGPWENEEMQAALRLAVNDKRPVIPVVLPSAPGQPELPMFLGNRTWVDLRSGIDDEALDKLVWGITGKKA